jgi:hypothetical protein
MTTQSHKTLLASERFPGAPFGPLVEETCLVWHDEPLLSLATDTDGRKWLIQTIDSDSDARIDTIIVVQVSDACARELAENPDIERLIPCLSAIYMTAETGFVVRDPWGKDAKPEYEVATKAEIFDASPAAPEAGRSDDGSATAASTPSPILSKPFTDLIAGAIQDGRISTRRAAMLLGVTVDDLTDLFRGHGIEPPVDP